MFAAAQLAKQVRRVSNAWQALINARGKERTYPIFPLSQRTNLGKARDNISSNAVSCKYVNVEV